MPSKLEGAGRRGSVPLDSLGGDRMDHAIVDYLRRHYSLRIGLPAAERLRIQIGSAYPLDEELVGEVSGLDIASGLPRKATVTSEEIARVVGALRVAIASAGELLRLT